MYEYIYISCRYAILGLYRYNICIYTCFTSRHLYLFPRASHSHMYYHCFCRIRKHYQLYIYRERYSVQSYFFITRRVAVVGKVITAIRVSHVKCCHFEYRLFRTV